MQGRGPRRRNLFRLTTRRYTSVQSRESGLGFDNSSGGIDFNNKGGAEGGAEKVELKEVAEELHIDDVSNTADEASSIQTLLTGTTELA